MTKCQKRISGRLLDRIDIHVDVQRVGYRKLSDDRLGERSSAIQARVEQARELQRRRFAGSQQSESRSSHNDRGKASLLSVVCNADMRVGEIRQFCKPDGAEQSLIRAEMGQVILSARGYHRVVKLARTIADLAGYENIQGVHVAEALQYRPKMM